ncbi:Helix-turn-helix [Christiangramia echinicola]|uniref:Helix-turn-helix n=2 Tax=Christiangramia echinicola TaxID=279359 RepID=A0A1H1KVJ6_9FLAO|nr:Helix-turn-helix [Christiangramia echinicola]
MDIQEIKNFRKRHNLTQSDLAEIVGVKVSAVSKWEIGQRNISNSAIKLIRIYDENNFSNEGLKNENQIDLKEFRNKYNLTQADLAKITSCKIGTVQSWEQGRRNIPKNAIKLLTIFEKNKVNGQGENESNKFSRVDLKLDEILNYQRSLLIEIKNLKFQIDELKEHINLN